MGGSTEIQQPSVPEPQSFSSSISDYVANYPKLMQLEQQYAPQEAALQLQLAQQYAVPLGKAMQSAQESLYPETSKLQEQLAKIASEGMTSSVPDWMKEQYRSSMAGMLGSNVQGGIGADYMSRGLMQQQMDWNNYYQNLGLSVAGRQPLSTPGSASYTNQLSNYTPSMATSYNASTYSPYASLYGNMYNTNAQMSQQSPAWANALGTIGGAALGMAMPGIGKGLGTAGGMLPKIW
ncbi:MAG: hypothetical protein WC444_07250 [Candidatus Paceibacterota bacterium]